MDTWEQLIVRSPDVLQGAPRFEGTRIPVTVVLDSLAEGIGAEELHEAYPTLPQGAIEATLRYAAAIVRVQALDNDEVA